MRNQIAFRVMVTFFDELVAHNLNDFLHTKPKVGSQGQYSRFVGVGS